MTIYKISINKKTYNTDFNYYHLIDNNINGEKFTLKNYLAIENKYIKCITSLLNCFNEDTIIFEQDSYLGLQNDKHLTNNIKNLFDKIKFVYSANLNEFPDLIKLLFRGYLTGIVHGKKIKFYIYNSNHVYVEIANTEKIDTQNIYLDNLVLNKCSIKSLYDIERIQK